MTNEWNSRILMWMEALKRSFYKPMEQIVFSYFVTHEYVSAKEAECREFSEIKEGDSWGREWEYGWFKSCITLGEWAKGQRIVMDLNLGGESTLFVNGDCFGTRRDDWIVEQHHFICDNYLTREAAGGENFCLMAECYAGHERPKEGGECAAGPHLENKRWIRPDGDKPRRVLGKSTYGIWREDVYQLYLEVKALYDIRKNLEDSELRAAELEAALQKFAITLDFEQEEEGFLLSVKKCRELIRPYLLCVNGTTAPVMHAVGHAHIDLEWLWTLEETKRKCARTMAAQLRHMDEYPEYRMLLSQPYIYELLKKYYPKLYAKLLEKIKTGQLIPEGGMWVESDTNLPSGESLIRQFLYGKKFFKEELGIDSQLLWLPDVFGYSGALPQIMKGCQIKYFSTHKIFWTYNGGEPFPYHYFDWQGIDGTRVPTFIHVEYSSPTDGDTMINRWKNRAQKTELKRFLLPFGYGDGGGGASRDHIEYCRMFQDLEGVPKIKFDDPNSFFETIEKDYENRQEYEGELYYQAHRGTYTSQSKTKFLNRRCEFGLREAEIWSTIAAVSESFLYQGELLEKNWKKVLLNQFHDILPGSAIHKVYERAEREYEEVLQFSGDMVQEAAGTLAGRGEELAVFNSLSWERKVLVSIPDSWTEVWDGNGTPLVSQKTKVGTVCEVSVPPMGVNTVYCCLPSAKEIFDKNVNLVKAENSFLENDLLRVTFNKKGEISSIFDKETKSEWTAGVCNEFQMYQDIPSHFEAWDLDSMYASTKVNLDEEAVLEVVESGELYAQIKVVRKLNESKIIQNIRLAQGSRRIEFETQIDWKESHKLLKTAFPVNVITNELVSEIQYGYIKRPNHKSRNYDKDRFEVCNQKWSALYEQNRGCAILNDSKYGISSYGNSMELTLLKSATFPDETADVGIQKFQYAFTCWNQSFLESEIIREAYELNTPVTVVKGNIKPISYFAVDSHYIIIDTLKMAEDDPEAIILRMYESKGSTTSCRLSVMFQIEEAVQTDMLEKEQKRLEITGQIPSKVALDFRPFEVKTVKIKKRRM